MISPMFIRSQRKLTSVVSTVSKVLRGGGAKNGAERARKSNEREWDLKKYCGAGAGGHVSGAVSGE